MVEGGSAGLEVSSHWLKSGGNNIRQASSLNITGVLKFPVNKPIALVSLYMLLKKIGRICRLADKCLEFVEILNFKAFDLSLKKMKRINGVLDLFWKVVVGFLSKLKEYNFGD